MLQGAVRRKKPLFSNFLGTGWLAPAPGARHVALLMHVTDLSRVCTETIGFVTYLRKTGNRYRARGETRKCPFALKF